MRKPPRTPTADDIAEMQHLRRQGMLVKDIIKKTGFSSGLICKHCEGIDKPKSQPELEDNWQENETSATYTGITAKPIKTLDDALEVAGVDKSVWYVDRWECSQWTVGMMPKDADKPVQTQQYRVKVFLKRIFARSLQQAQEALFQRMAKESPKFPPAMQKVAKVKGDYLAVMGLFDAHFGKFAWGRETGGNFDVAIAEQIYQNAVDDLMASLGTRSIGRWLLPIGNDFFHMDNSRNTTFAGTPLDVDGRYAKVIEAGEMSVVRAIQRMLTRAPVDITWIPGNHDPTTSYHLARFIWAYFSKCDAVNVDYSPPPRKYYSWGANLIGLTHGNEEKIHELPNLMASEKPEEWLDSRNGSREWLIGHWHQSKKWVTKTTESSQETVIRALRSLSGTDAWHHRKGYVGAHQAAEVYLYDRVSGYSGHNVAYARAKKK